jgi:hypothetical protein
MIEHDLRLLNDALARTELAGRYWVWGGLLLGWAREGRVLPHDRGDADFAFSADDHERFLRAVPALIAAGFSYRGYYRNNAGEITEHVLERPGAHFDFFRMADAGERYQYYMYGPDYDDRGPWEFIGRVKRQELEPFEFLGRTWLKPADHEAELEAIYGDWRTPNPRWCYLQEGTLIARTRWE